MSEFFPENMNITQMITVQVSDELLWGYQIEVSRDELLNDPQSVASRIQRSLLEMFNHNNLVYLADRIANRRFHIHDTTPDNLGIVYACSSCADNYHRH